MSDHIADAIVYGASMRSVSVSARQQGKTQKMKGKRPVKIVVDDIDDWWQSGIETARWMNNQFRELVQYQPPMYPDKQRGKSRHKKPWEHNKYGN